MRVLNVDMLTMFSVLCYVVHTVRVCVLVAGGHYPPDSDYGQYVTGAVDMLSFASGSATSSAWSKLRATMGHPAPFKLWGVEIGNEEVDEPTGSYAKHFALLTEAMWKVEPGLEVVASGRWGNPRYYSRFLKNPCLNGQKCWAWDEHLYGTADSMYVAAAAAVVDGAVLIIMIVAVVY